ncbi:MAG: hypothetical protein WDM96_10255 [Lacunisphaera sp.]
MTAPGLVQVPLPPDTFDAAQPGLADLRLLDPAGPRSPLLPRSRKPGPGRPAARGSCP